MPELLPGPGPAVQGDACALVGPPALPDVDLAYLDPPYNQHRYDANYHVWETLVAWDAPDALRRGLQARRARDPATRSAFNGRRTMPVALAGVVTEVAAEVVVLSYNNESWLSFDELHAVARPGATSRSWPSTRPATWGPGSASTTRRAARWAGLAPPQHRVRRGGRPRARVGAMARAAESAGLGARVDRPVPVPAA